MTKKTLGQHLFERLQSIRLCYEKGHHASCLILIYCTIDMLAWLAMLAGRTKSTRKDFISWVDKYLLPASGLSVTAIDLYAARCALVHTYTSRSKLIEEGTATQLLYSWRPTERAAELQSAIDGAGIRGKAVHLQNLFTALERGIHHFLEEIRTDPQQTEAVERRAAWFYSSISKVALSKPSPDT